VVAWGVACASISAVMAYLLLIMSYGTEQAAYMVCNFDGFPEGTTVLSRASLWPPGTHCFYRLPDGTVVERTSGFGGVEAALVGLAALVGSGASLVLRRIRRRND
jgi:hypothetical protein